MKKETLAKIEKILLKKQKELENELQEIAEKDSSRKNNFRSKFPDFGTKDEENAAEVAAYSDNLAIEHTLENDLRDVKKALQNIKKGTYGICKYCKKPIKEERLVIRPTSSSCVECKKTLKGEE